MTAIPTDLDWSKRYENLGFKEAAFFVFQSLFFVIML